MTRCICFEEPLSFKEELKYQVINPLTGEGHVRRPRGGRPAKKGTNSRESEIVQKGGRVLQRGDGWDPYF